LCWILNKWKSILIYKPWNLDIDCLNFELFEYQANHSVEMLFDDCWIDKTKYFVNRKTNIFELHCS
jgi:hypothetical protein